MHARRSMLAVVLGGCVSAVGVAVLGTYDGIAAAAVVSMMVLACAAVGAAVVCGTAIAFQRVRGREQKLTGRLAAVAALVGLLGAFPVRSGWDEQGHRVSGVVPAAQMLAAPVWPASAWNNAEPAAPVVAYEYSCCSKYPLRSARQK